MGGAALAAGDVDVVTAFDCVGRTQNLPALIKDVHTALRPGGLMVLTAPAASGLEPLVLWDRSPTIMPPDKLNLLTVEGFEALFSAPEWEIVELSTPGGSWILRSSATCLMTQRVIRRPASSAICSKTGHSGR